MIPIRANGTKKPVFEWKRFTKERPSSQALDLWWSEIPNLGIGVICGAVSGNLEMLELEGRANDTESRSKIIRSLEKAGNSDVWDALGAGLVVRSPSGGVHFYYRITDHEVPGNTRIARRPATAEELAENPEDKWKVLVETRGEGGYVVAPPSGGAVHKSGLGWRILVGDQTTIPEITWDERNRLHTAIREALDESPAYEPPPARPTIQSEGDRPGDEFNAKATWAEILEPHGWRMHPDRGHNGEILWTRPGKEHRDGHSASTGYANDADRLYVWSSSTEFQTEIPYTKFAAFALLEFNNDYAAASRELRKRGYGSVRVSSPFSAASRPGKAQASRSGPVVDAPETAPVSLDLEVVVGELEGLADNRQYIRDLIPQLVNLDEIDLAPWRNTVIKFGGIGKREFAVLLKQAKADAVIAAAKDDDTKNVLPNPNDPMRTAAALVKKLPRTGRTPHLLRWREDWYSWDQTKWITISEETVKNWLYRQTAEAVYLTPTGGVADWLPNRTKISDLTQALGVGTVYREHNDDPDREIACTNGILNIDTMKLEAHTPDCFNLFSLPFEYQPEARCPQWMTFLDQVLPDDKEAQAFLQEWFGYMVSGRTDLQKMASLVGAPRCGKGTIARVLVALLGQDVVASPTLEHLASQFGEQGLIGKSLALMSDVRWNARATVEAVPRILAITGEDSRSVPRKNRDDWNGKLDVRFMVMSNDSPKFSDSSGALAGRMIHVKFTQSFLGREDPSLTEKLKEELSGILNWALEGLARLTERGRFEVPKSSYDVDHEVQELSSPEKTFIEDYTEVGGEVLVDDAYAVYRTWCLDNGQEHIPTKIGFSRNLTSAVAGTGVEIKRRRTETGQRERYIVGLHFQAWVRIPPKWASGVPGGRSF